MNDTDKLSSRTDWNRVGAMRDEDIDTSEVSPSTIASRSSNFIAPTYPKWQVAATKPTCSHEPGEGTLFSICDGSLVA
jgi:hypothetical protein